MSDAPLIHLDHISKSFGKVKANQDVCLDIKAGKVLALLGENGAGKSTLMSVLAGQLQPDSGTISHCGQPVRFTSTEDAIRCGIGMVYQHFKLIDALTVAENIFLGRKDRIFFNWKKLYRKVEELAERYAMHVSPHKYVRDLSMGEKQQVEILKLLQRESSILIFDEPTAVLTPKEAENLFQTIQQMAADRKGIVFISHKLDEVMAISDSIAILRRGKIIDTVATDAVASTAELAERMVGREVLLQVERKTVEHKQIVLQVNELSNETLTSINMEIRQGEILGLVGVAGNGQKELVETICGLRHPDTGSVRILGKDWKKFFARMPWENALSYVPEDRQGLATCRNLDLLDNFLLTTRNGFVHGPCKIFLDRNAARQKAEHLINEFDVRPDNLEASAWQLSGGNLQKWVLAREFFRRPRLIVTEQPTQGLDIAAMEDVWNLLLTAREEAGILLVTGDLVEALTLSDRIGVMYGGRMVACFDVENEKMRAAIPQMMAGLHFPQEDV